LAFTAVAALAAGAEVSAGLVLAAVAEVGTALTVVGAVTGSKDLMKIGGAMALVGGVGGLVNGAISGTASTAVEGAVTNEAATAADYVNAADAASDAATAGSAASSAAPQLASASPQLAEASTSSAGNGIVAQAQLAPPAVETPASSVVQTPSAQMASDLNSPLEVGAPSGAHSPTGPVGAQAPQGAATPYDNIDVGGGYNPASGSTTAPADSGSFLSRVSDWATKNKTLLQSGQQLVGGALNGMNQRSMWDQKMALEQQRVNQTKYGNTVGNFAPANPGLISGARA
jgi:hypothetical protein